jgi:hypothetical protein
VKLGIYYDKRSAPVAEEFMARREKRGYDRKARRDRTLQDLRIHQADEALRRARRT